MHVVHLQVWESYPIRNISRRTSDTKKILYFILKRVAVELWITSHSVDDTCYNFDILLHDYIFLTDHDYIFVTNLESTCPLMMRLYHL